MKLIIEDADLNGLHGKWFVQLNTSESQVDIRTDFYLEKRVRMINILQDSIQEVGIFYSNKPMPRDKFILHFNECAGGQRFYRFLNPRELDWLSEQIKKRNN